MFDNLSDKLQATFEKLNRRGTLRESDVNAAMREVRLALLEADVNYKVVKSFVARVKERAIGVEVAKSLNPAQQVIKIVNEELVATLGEPGKLDLSRQAPHVIMLAGLQGSGKTTTAAKLALHLRKKGQRPLLVAADIYRPAAIKQLEILGQSLDIPVHSEGDRVAPPDICANAVKRARQSAYSVVILDTAGRLHIDETLMDELVAIKKRVHPVETLLVVDAMTGQDAVRVAKTFNEKIGLSGLILTKVDGDARGGAAISVREVTGVPIKFLGTGEGLDALDVFQPDRLASRILGMGDILTLIEKAEQTMDRDTAMKMEHKLRTASFTLEDFQKQLQEVKKMGPLSSLMEMIPGMGQLSKQVSAEETDEKLRTVEAIINSMTKEERNDPAVINGRRKKRIAAGSGHTVQEVNALLSEFRQIQRMMKQLAKGKGPGNLLSMFR